MSFLVTRNACRRAAQVSLLVANLVFVMGIASPHLSKSLVPLNVGRVIPKQAIWVTREAALICEKFFTRWINYSANKSNIYTLNLTEQLFGNTKSVKLELFSHLESQDIDRWLQKFQNPVESGGHRHDSASMATHLASHLSGPAETFYFSLAPETRRYFDELMASLKNRFSSEDVKWRLRQSLSVRKQGGKESLDSYIEFINSTCQKMGAFKEDQLHFFVNGLHDEIKREVLMHKPLDYQSPENLASLKVSAFARSLKTALNQ